MKLRQYATVIWKWLWLILLATTVAAFSSWWVVKDQPPVYQTSATLMVGQAIEKTNPTWSDFDMSERLSLSYSELIMREPILRAAAEALGFEDQWATLQEKIQVDLVPGTQLMEISVTDTDPQRAKLIADEVTRQLIVRIEESRPQSHNREFIEEQVVSFPPKIEAAQREIQKLEAELGAALSARQIQDIQERINTLEEQINNWQATFAQYQLLLGEGGVNVLTVFEEAPLPSNPAGPDIVVQMVLAAAIGMILAMGAAFLIEYLDDSLKSPDDVQEATGLITLGSISRIAGNKQDDKLVTVRYPKSPISEAYRAMRTSLQFSAVDEPLRSLVVTSPSPSEGKSTTVANLGVAVAQANSPVVLVDADLRQPILHKIFGLRNRKGLTGLLLQETISLDGWLHETGIRNLRVLTSGPLPPNPSELLGSQKMCHLIEALEKEADMIIFDTPPALAVTDATVLSTQTHGVLLVADAGRTKRAAARQAVVSLQQVGANILGVALNRVQAMRSGGYYYYMQDSRGRRRKRRQRPIPILGRLFGR